LKQGRNMPNRRKPAASSCSEHHSVTELTQQNVEAIAKMQLAANERRTFGERVADGVAQAVGSWPFIIVQTILLAAWVVVNVVAWIEHWDPYPFILLNLLLSFQAAYASPIIMMSQNRQAKINERRNHLDLQINLLAEQEITEILKLLHKLCKKLEIPVGDQHAIEALEQATEPEHLIDQIVREVEQK
jgi:uncharacterized membrane protein